MHRLLLPVKVSCLALSKLGTYLVCGTHDGRLFLWEVSRKALAYSVFEGPRKVTLVPFFALQTATGYLLASFDGHYRAVTCLAWTDDDAAFISGGDDSVCHVWSLPMCVVLFFHAPSVSRCLTCSFCPSLIPFGQCPSIRRQHPHSHHTLYITSGSYAPNNIRLNLIRQAPSSPDTDFLPRRKL